MDAITLALAKQYADKVAGSGGGGAISPDIQTDVLTLRSENGVTILQSSSCIIGNSLCFISITLEVDEDITNDDARCIGLLHNDQHSWAAIQTVNLDSVRVEANAGIITKVIRDSLCTVVDSQIILSVAAAGQYVMQGVVPVISRTE